MLQTDQASIAACGVTRPKASYIHGLAEQADHLMEQPWETMSDDAIMKHLVKFRGIGPWTAEMLLMFHFLRPDVFSLGDIGLIRGTQRLVPEAETKEAVGEIAERWRPYRTAAAWYLWRILDPVPWSTDNHYMVCTLVYTMPKTFDRAPELKLRRRIGRYH